MLEENYFEFSNLVHMHFFSANRVLAIEWHADWKMLDLKYGTFTHGVSRDVLKQKPLVKITSLKKMEISAKKKKEIIKSLGGRKTPQLRPQYESIILAQKPREGTFVQNWLTHETGLIDFTSSLDGLSPSTVMTVEKSEKCNFNNHLTVKPVMLIEHLISLFSKPNQTILDLFLGSGSTYIAAKNKGRFCLGIEINEQYFDIASQRIKGGNNDGSSTKATCQNRYISS